MENANLKATSAAQQKVSFEEILRKYSVVFTVLLMIIVGVIITKGDFLSGDNLLNVGERAAAIGIIALGQMLVILTGGMDLSVSGIVAVGYAITSLLLAASKLPVPIIMLLTIVGTTICGAINGLLVSRTKVPPFMLTLGTYMVFQSLALVLSQAQNMHYNGVVDFMKNSWHLTGLIGRLFPTFLWVFISLVVMFILAFSRVGKNIYHTGGKELSARMSGINTKRIKFLVYTAAGFLCGIAAILLEFRLQYSNATSTGTFQIASIAAVIIGGTNIKGGEGNVYGTFIGAFIMASLENLMNLVGVLVYSQEIIKGIFLLIFLGITLMLTRRNRKNIFLN